MRGNTIKGLRIVGVLLAVHFSGMAWADSGFDPEPLAVADAGTQIYTLLSDERMLNSDSLVASTDVINAFPENTIVAFPMPSPATSADPPTLSGSIPADQATNFPPNGVIALRFSKSMEAETLSPAFVTLVGPAGPIETHIDVVEAGRLAYVRPTMDLLPGSNYTVFVDGARAVDQSTVPLLSLAFATASLGDTTSSVASLATTDAAISAPVSVRISSGSDAAIAALQATCTNTDSINSHRFCHEVGDVSGGIFTPGQHNTQSRWRLNTPLPALLTIKDWPIGTFTTGDTAVFGTVRRIDDQPLANVTVAIGSLSTKTDTAGRFVLKNAPEGKQILLVDGTSANVGQEEYGEFTAGINVPKGVATAVPFNLYVPRISVLDKIHLPSPTTVETVITHPAIPGLEIHIPAGTVIRDRHGKILTDIAIVPLPVDRSPVPLPDNFPVYFSAQPGGAFVQGLTPEASTGMRIIYPNYTKADARPGRGFWFYDPEHEGWTIYSRGQVSEDGSSVIPDTHVAGQRFMPEGGPSVGGPAPATHRLICGDGDPVDCGSGTFLHSVDDLTINDIVPIVFNRTYNSSDTSMRSFGQGMANSFGMYLYSPDYACFDPDKDIGNEIDLVTGDGGVYPFIIDVGTSIDQEGVTILRHTSTPSRFYGATMRLAFAATAFPVTLADGTQYQITVGCPGQLVSTTDRFGNTLTMEYSGGLLTGIASPTGRSLAVNYNSDNEISQITDSVGRSVSYGYNPAHQLTTVTYPDHTTEQYSYDGSGNLLTVTDRRGNTMVSNQYDINQRVYQQTYADSSTYQFAYTLIDSTVMATDVTDGLGHVKHLTFDSDGYPLTITRANGTSIAQTISYVRDPTSHTILSMTDALGRQTQYTRDNNNNITQATYLAGTANAVAYNFSYTADFGQVASMTDPLGNTTSLNYTNGCLTQITDPLGHSTTISCNAEGQPLTITDALGRTTTYAYNGYDLDSVTDPLGRTVQYATDDLGRTTAALDPLGNLVLVDYDTNNRVVYFTDGLGRTSNLVYDGNGNLTSVTDPNLGVTQFQYDSRNRQTVRTDALNQSESWTYDAMGNAQTYTDRKNQETTYLYDALNRPSLVTYADSSTATPTFDAGNRLTQIVDTNSGTITREYDGLDRLTQEQTPQGTVNYQYDNANRRTQMTAASQLPMTYTYDNASRLTQLNQGSETVGIDYDSVDRRLQLTLPNGIQIAYGYDAANEITAINYTHSGTTLGALSYSYDLAGRRIGQGGTWASNVLPTPWTATASFDLNNRQTSANGFSISYDTNGDPITNNAATPSAQTYTFDVRHRLTQIQQGGSTLASFQYDPLGRRTSKTISGTTTTFLYDGENTVQETQGASTYSLLTGLGIDERFARSEPAGRYYFLTDALGSTLALTDATGTVQQTYAYEPFGQVTATGTSNNPYQYTGRENDGTGLDYYRNRYYSSFLKHFISEDPLGLAAGLNSYAYALNNPIRFIDPLGLAVNINLTQPGTPEYNFGQNVNPPSGSYSIFTHSDGQNACSPCSQDPNKTTYINANGLASMVLNDPNYHPGMAIMIYGCNTGNGDNSLAYQLEQSIHNGSAVAGPNGFLMVTGSGQSWVGPDGYKGPGNASGYGWTYFTGDH